MDHEQSATHSECACAYRDQESAQAQPEQYASHCRWSRQAQGTPRFASCYTCQLVHFQAPPQSSFNLIINPVLIFLDLEHHSRHTNVAFAILFCDIKITE